MSIIPAILDMNNYYVSYEKNARRLKLSDVGKKVKKVIAATANNGGSDHSYTGKEFIVESIEMGHYMCFHCNKDCDFLCGKCKQKPFCSKECQTKAWKIWHSVTCDSSESSKPREKPIKKIVLIDYKGQKVVLDTNEGPLCSKYFYGWVVCDEVCQIKLGTTVSDSHINQLKGF